jgi:mRNA interferase RelE/StbE
VKPFQPVIPPHVAEVIRALHPDLKRSIKAAIRAIAIDPECGEPLRRELLGLWKFRVRRFRIVYATDRAQHIIRLMAVGPRQSIYEELTDQLRGKVG